MAIKHKTQVCFANLQFAMPWLVPVTRNIRRALRLNIFPDSPEPGLWVDSESLRMIYSEGLGAVAECRVNPPVTVGQLAKFDHPQLLRTLATMILVREARVEISVLPETFCQPGLWIDYPTLSFLCHQHHMMAPQDDHTLSCTIHPDRLFPVVVPPMDTSACKAVVSHQMGVRTACANRSGTRTMTMTMTATTKKPTVLHLILRYQGKKN